MSEELKVKSFRATDEVYEKFKKIANDEFESQGQCLANLIGLYELEKSKTMIPERKLELENFQAHTYALIEMFLTSLQLNQDAELRIRTEFKNELVSKDKTIIDLQEKMEVLKAKATTTTEECKLAQNQNQELNVTLTNLKNQVNELAEKNQMSQKEFNATLKDKEQLNAMLSDQCIEYKKKIKDMQEGYQNMEKQIANLETIKQERDDFKTNLETLNSNMVLLKQQRIMDTEKSLLEKEKQYQAEMEQIKNTYQSEINKYQEKIESLLMRLEEMQVKKTSKKKSVSDEK